MLIVLVAAVVAVAARRPREAEMVVRPRRLRGCGRVVASVGASEAQAAAGGWLVGAGAANAARDLPRKRSLTVDAVLIAVGCALIALAT